MKKIFVLMIVLLVLAVLASPASAIIGGVPDFEHTNVGAIMMVWPQFDDIVGRLCSGTLIHERALLTAAHCYKYFVNQGINYEQIWVTFNQDPFADDAEYLPVEKFVPHEDLNLLRPDSHDIALVILEKPVKRIDTESLPNERFMDDVIEQTSWQELEMIMVGYGVTDPEVTTAPEIQLDAERRNGYFIYKDMTAFEIKTIKLFNPENPIYAMGDSGGPLFYKDSDGNDTLVGLGSCIDKDCWSWKGLYYRLDTESALDWIDANLPDD